MVGILSHMQNVPNSKQSGALNNKAVSGFFLIFRGGPVWSSSRALRNLQNHFYQWRYSAFKNMVLFPLKKWKNDIFEKLGYEMCKIIVLKLKKQFLIINTTSIHDLFERNTFIWQNFAGKIIFFKVLSAKKYFLATEKN